MANFVFQVDQVIRLARSRNNSDQDYKIIGMDDTYVTISTIEWTIDSRPVTPTAQQVADAASDYLSEIRKDAGYGWMVHQVLSAEEF